MKRLRGKGLAQARSYFADFLLYLADPRLAREVGAEPESGISSLPHEHDGQIFAPGDKVSCDYGFALVYEGELEGWAMCHHIGDLAKCRRRFSELLVEQKGYVQKRMGWE